MIRFFILGLALIFATLPGIAFAWVPGEPIVPMEILACAPLGCQACHLILLFNNLIAFAIYFAVLVASLMFAYAGFLYVTASANPNNLNSAKNIFTSGFLGLLLILTAWLIIDLTLSTFTGKPFGWWTDIQCTERVETKPGFLGSLSAEVVPNDETAFDELGGSIPITDIGTISNSRKISNEVARARLQSAGIAIKAGADLTNIREHVIEEIIAVKVRCNCSITVTEGTGGVHKSGTYSHANGWKLDLRTRDEGRPFLDYVKNNFTYSHNWRNGTPVYVDSCRNRYAIEGTHIDAQIFNVCPSSGG